MPRGLIFITRSACTRIWTAALVIATSLRVTVVVISAFIHLIVNGYLCDGFTGQGGIVNGKVPALRQLFLEQRPRVLGILLTLFFFSDGLLYALLLLQSISLMVLKCIYNIDSFVV